MNERLTPAEYADVVRAAAASKSAAQPYEASAPQKATVAILFNDFADRADVMSVFAVREAVAGDWFRHKCLEILFDKDSMNRLTMGEVGTLIDEFGTKVGGLWQLTDEGVTGLFLLMDLVAERNPRQQVLL